MTYATLPDLFARFGEDEITQITDTDGTNSPDMVLVNRALGDAAAEIDAALEGRYQLPMMPVPPLLQRIACDLARESLFTDAPSQLIVDRAKAARALLINIASGKLRFETAAPAVVSPAQSDARIKARRHRMSWPE